MYLSRAWAILGLCHVLSGATQSQLQSVRGPFPLTLVLSQPSPQSRATTSLQCQVWPHYLCQTPLFLLTPSIMGHYSSADPFRRLPQSQLDLMVLSWLDPTCSSSIPISSICSPTSQIAVSWLTVIPLRWSSSKKVGRGKKTTLKNIAVDHPNLVFYSRIGKCLTCLWL